MKRKNIRWIAAAGIVLLFCGVVVYQFTGGREYSSDVESARMHFNADKGKVRLLVLLAPS